MTSAELGRRRNSASEEPLVITKSEQGYKVYSVTMPSRSYQVTGTVGEPACTCPDFLLNHRSDADWRCKHILAVFHRDGAPPNGAPPVMASAELPEPANGGSAMLLKRSVSPDGRIDSLSIEISCPTDRVERGEIVGMAAEVLAIQSDIVREFLNGKGEKAPPDPPPAPTANGHPIPATLIGMEGMNGRWGRRLFLTFEVEGRTVKLFGTEQELAAAVSDAGHSQRANRLTEGIQLSVPCRVITRPARDSRYVDIVQVLPAASGPDRRRYR